MDFDAMARVIRVGVATVMFLLAAGCARPRPPQDDALRPRPPAPQREPDPPNAKPHFACEMR
jgi:hypothetical protein